MKVISEGVEEEGATKVNYLRVRLTIPFTLFWELVVLYLRISFSTSYPANVKDIGDKLFLGRAKLMLLLDVNWAFS